MLLCHPPWQNALFRLSARRLSQSSRGYMPFAKGRSWRPQGRRPKAYERQATFLSFEPGRSSLRLFQTSRACNNSGTSFSALAFAGIPALIDQNVGSRQGNPNLVLYRLAASEFGNNGAPDLSRCDASEDNQVGGSCIFDDVTRGHRPSP